MSVIISDPVPRRIVLSGAFGLSAIHLNNLVFSIEQARALRDELTAALEKV